MGCPSYDSTRRKVCGEGVRPYMLTREYIAEVCKSDNGCTDCTLARTPTTPSSIGIRSPVDVRTPTWTVI
jgi:hypothetical protein